MDATQKISDASMRVPTTRSRTSAPAAMRAASPAETKAGSPAAENS